LLQALKCYNISKFLDKGVVELIGPYGLASTLNKLALNISRSIIRVIKYLFNIYYF